MVGILWNLQQKTVILERELINPSKLLSRKERCVTSPRNVAWLTSRNVGRSQVNAIPLHSKFASWVFFFQCFSHHPSPYISWPCFNSFLVDVQMNVTGNTAFIITVRKSILSFLQWSFLTTYFLASGERHWIGSQIVLISRLISGLISQWISNLR